MVPADIKKKMPQYWKEEHEEGSKNEFEGELFAEQLKSIGVDKVRYHKVTNMRKE